MLNTIVHHPLELEIHSDFVDKSIEWSASDNRSLEDEDHEVGFYDSVSSEDIELENELEDAKLEDELKDVDLVDELEDVDGSSDEEFVAARHKFKGTISKLVNSLERLQREVALGMHGTQQKNRSGK